jgi:hypothetical protein
MFGDSIFVSPLTNDKGFFVQNAIFPETAFWYNSKTQILESNDSKIDIKY